MNDLGPPRTAPRLDLVDLMGLTAVFSTLDLEGRAVLARFFTPVDLSAGARLITQGEDADTLYIIAAGSVEVVAEEDGQHVRLVRLGPGEVLGETALNHRGPRNASVDVMEDGLAWEMPVAAFQALASAGDPVAPAVLQGLGRVLCQRLRATDQRIADRTEEEPLPPALTAQVQSPQGTQAIAPAGPELLPLMRTLPIFAGAAARSMDDLTRLLPFLRVWTLPAGGALFTEGAPGTSAFLLLRGVVEVTVERGLEQQRLAILGPGRLFGEVSLIDGASVGELHGSPAGGGAGAGPSPVRGDGLLREHPRGAADPGDEPQPVRRFGGRTADPARDDEPRRAQPPHIGPRSSRAARRPRAPHRPRGRVRGRPHRRAPRHRPLLSAAPERG